MDPYPLNGTAAEAGEEANRGIAVPRREGQLPGAVENPCCMGTAAGEMLEVIGGFIEEEQAICRKYRRMLRGAPAREREMLRNMEAEKAYQIQKLMAVYYLVAGSCYQVALAWESGGDTQWCALLREQYHQEACSAFNYARAAEGTTDTCLQKLLKALAETSSRHAEALLCMLARAMK